MHTSDIVNLSKVTHFAPGLYNLTTKNNFLNAPFKNITWFYDFSSPSLGAHYHPLLSIIAPILVCLWFIGHLLQYFLRIKRGCDLLISVYCESPVLLLSVHRSLPIVSGPCFLLDPDFYFSVLCTTLNHHTMCPLSWGRQDSWANKINRYASSHVAYYIWVASVITEKKRKKNPEISFARDMSRDDHPHARTTHVDTKKTGFPFGGGMQRNDNLRTSY